MSQTKGYDALVRRFIDTVSNSSSPMALPLEEQNEVARWEHRFAELAASGGGENAQAQNAKGQARIR